MPNTPLAVAQHSLSAPPALSRHICACSVESGFGVYPLARRIEQIEQTRRLEQHRLGRTQAVEAAASTAPSPHEPVALPSARCEVIALCPALGIELPTRKQGHTLDLQRAGTCQWDGLEVLWARTFRISCFSPCLSCP